MIYLTKGQQLFDNPGMVVYDQTGYYDDGSSVVCAAAHTPEEPLCRYEAKFIAYGNLVYNITDPEELMKQVLEIDSKSLFGKNNQDVATDKVVDTIQTVESSDAPTNPEVNPVTNPTEVENALASTTPLTNTDTGISTTTPPTQPNTQPIITETKTDEVLEEITPILENVIEDLTQVTNVVEAVGSTTTPLQEITF